MAMPSFVARCLAVMTAAYPNAAIRRETLDVYVYDLSDIPDEVLDQACAYCRANLKFFPTIAEIREAAARLQSGANQLPPAAEAWGEFIRLGQYFSGDDPCPFESMSSDVLRRTIKAMGWRYLCGSTNGVADRARFIELYNQYAERKLKEYVTPPQLKAGEQNALAAMNELTEKLSESSRRKNLKWLD